MIFLYLFFIFHIFISGYNGSDIVEQLTKWPVPVETVVNFTINKYYNEKSNILIKIVSDNNEILAQKSVIVTKRSYVDLSTDYFVIKREKILYDNLKFSLSISFYTKSYGHYLLMEWNENDSQSLIYKEKISLTKDWRIDMKVQVVEFDDKNVIYVDNARFFQPGKRAKVTCTAYDGLPQTSVYVNENTTKRFRDVSYDDKLNQWIGYFTLAISDHNHSLSCHVRGSQQSQSYNIVVNHPTTALRLNPDNNGYIANGSAVVCEPVDGYPPPLIKFDFVSAKNHSDPKSLYQINNASLLISSTAVTGTELEFNCTAWYTNPLDNSLTILTTPFAFKVGDPPTNTMNLNMAAIGASVAGVVIIIIAVTIVVMLCRSKPKPGRSSSNQHQEPPKYDGSLLAGSKSAIRNQLKQSHNGSHSPLMAGDLSSTANTDQNELNYDDMPRGRRPIKVVDDPVIYSTIVGTMQQKTRPSLDLGPIDRV